MKNVHVPGVCVKEMKNPIPGDTLIAENINGQPAKKTGPWLPRSQNVLVFKSLTQLAITRVVFGGTIPQEFAVTLKVVTAEGGAKEDVLDENTKLPKVNLQISN